MRIALAALMLVILSACGTVESRVSQPQESAFITFTGRLDNVYTEISDFPRMNLLTDVVQDGKDKSTAVVELSPGQYSVKLFRGRQLLMNRTISLFDGDNRQVVVPE